MNGNRSHRDFKMLLLPGYLNYTPGGEDLVLLITEEEFMRMWARGQAMVRNRATKEKKEKADGKLSIKGSSEIS
jgi:hypothetical protein